MELHYRHIVRHATQLVTTMDSPLSMEVLMKELNDVYKKKVHKKLPKSFMSSVQKMTVYAENSLYAAEMYDTALQKMREKKKVRIVSANVPEGILPTGNPAILHDIRVNGHGPDDEIYNKDSEVRKLIPRGATILEFKGKSDVVIYANKKFTGGVGDEDEHQPENNDLWKQYCLEDPSTSSKVVCMNKVNGEAAHFSGRYIEGRFYLFTGSKNVHMLIRERKDIELYDGERYTVAKVVARSLWDTLNDLDAKHRQLMFSFLHYTKCTAVCELLQPENQHIINLSHLDKPQLNVISFTPVYSEYEESSLLALPPHHTLNLLTALGFTSPAYSIIEAKDVLQHQTKVRSELYKEGEVLYFLNKNEETIGMAKSKTFWYIIIRALREKAVYCFTSNKKPQNWCLEDGICSTCTRLEEIQNWLKFSDSYLQRWKEMGKGFLQWLSEELEKEQIAVEDIRPKFPIIWEKFLSDKEWTDKIYP
nr:uncharacterized protein LOC123775069 isoform X2 [Procambarus clarkii]